jgi:hypothetical protein
MASTPTTILVRLSLTLALVGPAGAQQTVRLAPTADTHVRDIAPNENNGSSVTLWIGRGVFFGLGNVRTLLKFDLAGLPTDPTRIQGALLSIYQFATEPAAGGLANNLHRVTQPWSEGQVTWNNQPAYDAQVWATAYPGDSFYKGWIDWDATGLVRAQASGAAQNSGWILRNAIETTGASRLGYFHSRESQANPFLRPKLVVTLYDLGLATTGSVQIGQPLVLNSIDATPGQPVFHFASITGPGLTTVPQVAVPIELDQPFLIGVLRAGAAGTTTLARPIPPYFAGVTLWLQAAQTQSLSNVLQVSVP